MVVTEDDRAATCISARVSARISACISAGRSRFAKGNATLGDLCDRVVVIVFFAIGRIGFPRVFIPTIDVILVFVGIVLFDFDFDRMVAFAVARHLIVGFGWRCNRALDCVEPVVKLSDEVDVEICRATRGDVRVLIEIRKRRITLAIFVSRIPRVSVVPCVPRVPVVPRVTGAIFNAFAFGVLRISRYANITNACQIGLIAFVTDAHATFVLRAMTASRRFIRIVCASSNKSRNSKAND